jgi:tetratricopeptide (TPR) repeat protein
VSLSTAIKSLEQTRSAEPDAESIAIEEGLGAVSQGRGQADLAIQYYEKALREADRIGDKTRWFELIWRKADTYLGAGEYEKAIGLCDTAVLLAKQISQENFVYLALASRGEAHLAKRDYDFAARDLSEAIEDAESLRGRVGGQEVERVSFFERKLRPYHLRVDLLMAQHNPAEALAYSEYAKGRGLLDVLATKRQEIASLMSDAERQRDRDLSDRVAALS